MKPDDAKKPRLLSLYQDDTVVAELHDGTIILCSPGADWDFIRQVSWRRYPRTIRGRIPKELANRKGLPRGPINMGRALLLLTSEPSEDHPIADHIDGNIEDNRRFNLRWVSYATSSRNVRSGGVSWHSRAKSWQVRLTLPSGCRKHVGYYKTHEKADRAFAEAWRKEGYHLTLPARKKGLLIPLRAGFQP